MNNRHLLRARALSLVLSSAALSTACSGGRSSSVPVISSAPTAATVASTRSATVTEAATALQLAAATASIADLHVSGNKILNGSGKRVILRGVDRSGTEYACIQGNGIFDGPSDRASVAAIASWHTNVVRVPLNEDCWLDINGVNPAYGGKNYRTAIVNFVNLLNANGLAAILDLHWNNSGTNQATGQEPMADAGHAPAFWASVATTFKSNGSVIFDLYNEPYVGSWSCWLGGGSASVCGTPFAIAGMNSLIRSVRGTGANNIVMAGGLAYANDLSKWLQYEPTDSAGQLAASVHIYNFNTCDTTSCYQSTIKPVAAVVPVIAGETGENDCNDTFVDPLYSYFDSIETSYLGWAWNADFDCSSGPGLVSDYNGTPTNYGIGLKEHLAALASQAR